MLEINEKDCCGCSLCSYVCPKNAIDMVEGELGSKFAKINNSLCIDCKLCEKVCPISNSQKLLRNVTFDAYAGVYDSKDIYKSSSGGIFAALATNFIEQGGICYGASYDYQDGRIQVKHIKVDNIKNLDKILGSKYAQSIVIDVFKEIKDNLNEGRKILFSGTPCQIAALRTYLRNEYKNLFCIDLICHGVPGNDLLAEYIKYLEKTKGKIENIIFRDKRYGWNSVGSITYSKEPNKYHGMYVSESSYYYMFEYSFTLRKSCYSCPFSSDKRVGDLTIGDYWGIEAEHPDYVKKDLDVNKGISCIMVNNSQGSKILTQYGKYTKLMKSSPNKIIVHNTALVESAKMPELRKQLLNIYRELGYDGLESWFNNRKNLKYYIRYILNRIPMTTKRKIRCLISKIKI